MKNRNQLKYFLLLLTFCSGATVFGQTGLGEKVSGTISDVNSGETLPGATVRMVGTNAGVAADIDGNYTITVPSLDDSLEVSFVGYLTKKVAISGRNTVNVTLKTNVNILGETVVIGYGTVKAADATGSTATLKSDDFTEGVVNSPQELLQGKTAGVVVTSNSGAPGNTSTIRIRGGASLSASNDPLIVIDDVPISNTGLGGSANILSTLNPNDIQSFTILKDASATAIYGSRASNGVIIITTKRGGEKFHVNYNFTGTVYSAPKKVDVYSGDEFRDLINEQYPNTDAVTSLLGDANTDWQDEIYKTAFGQDHSVTVSGTAANMPYRASVGYNNTDGILKTYNFERTTLSLGLDPSFLNDKLKVSLNVKGMFNHNNFADQAAIGDAIAYDPTQPVYDGNSRWRGYTTWTTGGINGNGINLAPGNPLGRLMLTDNTSNVQRSHGNAKIDYELPFGKDFHAVLNLGYDIAKTEGHNNVQDSTQWVYLPTVAGGRLNPYQSKANNQLLDFYLNKSFDLKSIDSKLEATAGYSWSKFYNSGSDSTMNADGKETTRVNVYETEYYLLSFFGRVNYSYKDKYLITATLRDDATSRFAPENRWGLFPAVAVGWKISEENFLKDSKWLSQLKLRASYGVTGQQDIYSNDYPYISTYTRSDESSQYTFGDSTYSTLRPDGYDRNIKWEETSTIDVGFDFGLFQDRIYGSVDFYQKKSDDLIAFIPIPVGTNFVSSLTTNVGSMKNTGFEFNLNGTVALKGDFQWDAGVNFTYNKNEISQLNLSDDLNFFIPLGAVGGTTAGTIQVHKVGEARQSYYVFQQVYDENGDPVEDVYVDRNGDGQINSSDLYVYQKPDATFLVGVNSRMTYKNWDFSFTGRLSLGNYVYNNVAANSTYSSLYNSMQYLRNTSTQADNTMFTTAQNTRFSDYYIENGSFFRMDNISVGYSFENLFNKSKLHVGLGVNNAFVITKYTGLDPEVSGGIDNNFFPRTRSYFLSLNFQL